jgi:hypothetical protein
MRRVAEVAHRHDLPWLRQEKKQLVGAQVEGSDP